MTGPGGNAPPKVAAPPAAGPPGGARPAAASVPNHPGDAAAANGDGAAAPKQPGPPDGSGTGYPADGAAQSDPTGTASDTAAPGAVADPATQTLDADGGNSDGAILRPGDGSRLAKLRDEAERKVIREFVNGDKYVFHHDGARVPLQLLSPFLLAQARHAFVAPDGWDAWRNGLRTQRTVILRGRRGRGRDTLATRLLISRGIEEIYTLDGGIDLGRLADRIAPLDADAPVPDRPTGYLVSRPDSLEGLRQLDGALEQTNAWIVLTIDDEMRLSDDEHLRYVAAEMPEMPGAEAILASHVRFHFADVDGRSVLDVPDVKAFIEEALPLVTSCEHAASIAQIIRQATLGGVTDVDAVRKRYTRRNTDQFGIWFGGLDDIDTRSLAIALGVLDGLPIDDVMRAARGLRSRLPTSMTIELADDGSLRQQRPDPLQAGLSERLDRLRAHTHAGEVVRPDGRVPATMLGFREQALATQVIERVWSDYQVQPILLDWLRNLMIDSTDDVRIHASTVVGLLATRSFDVFDRAVFTPWASQGSARQREAVAVALGFVATYEPRLRPVVTTTINGWYGSGKPLQQAAAARAYGATIGWSDPAAALNALGRLATVDNVHVAIAIGDSLGDMLTRRPPLAADVLHTLQEWAADRSRGRVGELCFLLIANGLTTIPADGRAAGSAGYVAASAGPARASSAGHAGASGGLLPVPGTQPRPTLLDYASEQPGLREPLFDLWSRVLTGASRHRQAAIVFTQWAAQVENDDMLLDTFGRLARALAGRSQRTRLTLRRLAATWVDEDNFQPLPRAAAKVTSVLG